MAREGRSIVDGPVRVFFSNPIAVIGFVFILLFASMVVIHPLLMNTLWSSQGDVYDPVTGYDAPIREVEVVRTVTILKRRWTWPPHVSRT